MPWASLELPSLPSAMPQGHVSVLTTLLSVPAAPKNSWAQNSWALRPNYLKPLLSRWVGSSGGSGKGNESQLGHIPGPLGGKWRAGGDGAGKGEVAQGPRPPQPWIRGVSRSRNRAAGEEPEAPAMSMGQRWPPSGGQ